MGDFLYFVIHPDDVGFACDSTDVGVHIEALHGDEDEDGVRDDLDNCPEDANEDQTDTDNDGEGDVCDICPLDPDNDADGDGVCGDVDCEPESDFSETVAIAGCDSGVENVTSKCVRDLLVRARHLKSSC